MYTVSHQAGMRQEVPAVGWHQGFLEPKKKNTRNSAGLKMGDVSITVYTEF